MRCSLTHPCPVLCWLLTFATFPALRCPRLRAQTRTSTRRNILVGHTHHTSMCARPTPHVHTHGRFLWKLQHPDRCPGTSVYLLKRRRAQ